MQIKGRWEGEEKKKKSGRRRREIDGPGRDRKNEVNNLGYVTFTGISKD